MQWHTTDTRYGALSIGLHWCMLLLLAAVYALMEFKGVFPRGSAGRAAMKPWHFTLGLSVLGLLLLRVLLFLRGPTPRIVPEPPLWQRRLAHGMKIGLLAFMLVTPLAGWLALSAAGADIPFFGWRVPALLAPDRTVAALLKEVHEVLATVGYGLIAVHAGAALFHRYVVHDNTLQRILPAWGR